MDPLPGWLKGWRTMAVNGIVVLAAAVSMILDYANSTGGSLTSILPAGEAAKVMFWLGLANVLLRVITTTPVGSK